LLANAQSIREFQVNFETGSFHLAESELEKIDNAIQSLSNPLQIHTVFITGHTDNVGDLPYNSTLSKNRANSVATYFLQKGFNQYTINTFAKAFRSPLATNATESGKAKNRRVSIRITDTPHTVKNVGGLKLKEDVYKIDNSEQQTINYKSGSKITIPANAFVDKNGGPVTGKVDLTYIEYRDAVDFILANIGMDVDPNTNDHFNSAGMNKILASQNGEPIFLKSGKNIGIEFPLTSDLPNLNFYSYDTISRRWTELAKINQPVAMPGGNDISPSAGSPCYGSDCQMVYSTATYGTDFARQSASISEIYETEAAYCDSIQIAINIRRQKSMFRKADSATMARHRMIRSYKAKIARGQILIDRLAPKIAQSRAFYQMTKISEDDDNLILKLDLKAMHNIVTVDFENTQWSHSKNNIRLNPELFAHQWDSCAIVGMNNGKYKINLHNSTRSITVNDLQIINQKTKDKTKLVAAMNKANKIQTKKIVRLRSKIDNLKLQKAQYEKALAELEPQLPLDQSRGFTTAKLQEMLCFFNNSATYMSDAEKSLSKSEWFKYFDANKAIMLLRYQNLKTNIADECRKAAVAYNEKQRAIASATENAGSLTKSLSISTLGIFNCDQIARLQEPLIATATYQTSDGKTFDPVMIYLVDSNINGIIRYDGYNGYNPNHFAYSAISNTTLLAFDGKGGSYIINAADFRKAVSYPKNAVFQMQKIKNIDSKEELAAMF
jgi:hypothetical protein